MERIFSLVENFSIRKEDFGGLVFLPISGETMQLNKSAYNLLIQLQNDGKIVCQSEKEFLFWEKMMNKKIIKEEKDENSLP